LGIVLGLLAVRANSVLPSILFHLIYNSLLIALVLLFGREGGNPSETSAWQVALAGGGAGAAAGLRGGVWGGGGGGGRGGGGGGARGGVPGGRNYVFSVMMAEIRRKCVDRHSD